MLSSTQSQPTPVRSPGHSQAINQVKVRQTFSNATGGSLSLGHALRASPRVSNTSPSARGKNSQVDANKSDKRTTNSSMKRMNAILHPEITSADVELVDGTLTKMKGSTDDLKQFLEWQFETDLAEKDIMGLKEQWKRDADTVKLLVGEFQENELCRYFRPKPKWSIV